MDREPDIKLQTEECKKKDNILRCPNMKETGGGFEGEQYHCELCKAAVYLDYEDMK